jgi:hypothetical protein
MNRSQKRKEAHGKRTRDQLIYQLGVLRKRWREMLDRVEVQSELNAGSIMRNIPAQTFLTDRLADVDEVIERCTRTERGRLTGDVNRLHADLVKFVEEAARSKGGE